MNGGYSVTDGQKAATSTVIAVVILGIIYAIFSGKMILVATIAALVIFHKVFVNSEEGVKKVLRISETKDEDAFDMN